MAWRPLPHIAYAIATHPFSDVKGDDLPLDIGDELYILEQGGVNGDWFRGYMSAQPSLLSGLTPLREGQGLEQRIYSGTFPRSCVEIKEILIEDDGLEDQSSRSSEENSRDSLGQIISADKAQEKLAYKEQLLEQLEHNTLPVPDQDAQEEKPQAPVPHLKAVDEDSANSSEPLIDEIASCLKEWWSNLYHKLALSGKYDSLAQVDHLVKKLDFIRRQLLHKTLTEAELAFIRERAIWKMNLGNKILTGEVVVRSHEKFGQMMDALDSPMELSSKQSTMSLLNEVPVPQVIEKSATLNHVLVDIKDIINTSPEPTTLVFYLVTKAKNSEPVTLSESFIVDCRQGSLENLSLKSRFATLFADLTAADVGDTAAEDSSIYLIIKANRTYVPIPLKPWEGRESATMSRENLATPFHAAHVGGINTGKGSMRRSIMMGSVKNVFKSPIKSKSPTKLNTLQEAFEPPTIGEARASTSSSITPPGTPGKAVARTVAVGALDLTEIVKETDVEKHAKVQLWTPSPAFDHNPQNKGADWDEIIRQLMGSQIGSYRRLPTMDKLDLVIKPYIGQDSASLVRNKPTELSGVAPTTKIGFSGAPTKPRNDVYVTIDKANFPEKALLSRTTGSATALSQRSDFKNVQIRLEVLNQNGVKVENAIYSSSNGAPVSSYDTTVIDKNSAWKETIRLAISPEDVKGAHLVMFTSDAPSYPFAVSHLPLWHEDAFMRDGSHDLLMYKNEDAASRAVSETTGKWYLKVKWSARGTDDTRKDEALTGPLSTLRIKTFLCSTAISQDNIILGLLNWKTQEQADVVHDLKQLLFCPEIEVVKQLNDVLNTLFAILVEHSENETFEDLVFTALVHVLNMAYDRRFNLSPLVDKYADEKFDFPFATPCLVRSFVRLLVATDPSSSKKLRSTFKVTKHIFKFITRGRSRMVGKEADIGITHGSNGFSNQLSALFNGLNSLMRSKEAGLIANQTIATQHFHAWLPELDPMLSHDEVVHCAIDFIDSMRDVKGKLIIYKLILLIKFSELDLFAKDKSPLLHNTVRWIKHYWGPVDGPVSPQYRDQVRLCCTVLTTQINDLGNLADNHLPNVISSYLALLSGPRAIRSTNLSLLFPRIYPFPVKPIDNKDDDFDEALVELAAIFSAISSSEQGLQLDNIADTKEDLANLVYNILKMQDSILDAEAFPKTWLSLYVYHHRSAMRTLSQVADVLLDSFLPGVEELSDEVVFLDELWKLFFQTLFKLITSETLALETFAQQKRRAVWSIAGDVRKEGAKLLSKMWHAIGWETDQDEQVRFGLKRMGGFQVQYVPALVPATLVMCMHVHEDLCAAGTEVLKSMIASEWQLNDSVAGIKPVIIDALDLVFRKKLFSEGSVQKNFIMELLQHFESRIISDEDPMKVQIRELLYNVADFLDLLDAVHASGTADEANQLIHRLALMEFLRDMDKTDTFIAYAHQLAAVQAAAGNFTEAGLALHHHADIYTWDTTKILPPIADPSYPSQTEFERKEAIFHEMIQRLEEGECWSMALQGYEELAVQYSENVFDFKKVARTYKSIGNVYEQIAKPDRPLHKYFRVCYGGLGFAAEFTQNQYMHEGKPGQEMAAFRDKIQEEYPEAQIIPSVEDYQEQEGQYISIDVCAPLREMSDMVNQRTKVPNVVKEYLTTRHPQSFTITKKKVYAGSLDEHYIEQIVLYTEEPFPTISRRSQIIGADLKKLDAVETAIYRVQRVNKILTTWEKGWFAKEDVSTYKLLVDFLQQEVDTGLNKKAVICTRALLPVANAKELTEENLTQLDPGQTTVVSQAQMELNDHQKALKTALIDEAVIINRILSNFAISAAALARSQGAELREKFVQSFDVELASIAPKPIVKVEDYQRPWNFSILGKVNSQRTVSPVKNGPDNRASNLSTLGPLPTMNQKPAMHKSRTSSSMTSSDSSLSSMAEKTPTGLRRASSFVKQTFSRRSEKDTDTASNKENQKPGKKSKRAPPVSFNTASNGGSGAKSIKRRESDAASTKSSRKSISSFSRHSFFGRNRADSNATSNQEAITDDGNSAWDTDSSRFVSTSTKASHGIFTGRGNPRYISDSIYRGASSTHSTAQSEQFSEPTSLTHANPLQEQQGRGGAVSRSASVNSNSTVNSFSKDSEAGYNYDTIRPVRPRSMLSPEKDMCEPREIFSVPVYTGVLGVPRTRQRLPSAGLAQRRGVRDPSIDARNDNFMQRSESADFGSLDDVARAVAAPHITIPPQDSMRPPLRPKRSTISSIGSVGSGMTNFDPTDEPVRVGGPGKRLTSNVDSVTARAKREKAALEEMYREEENQRGRRFLFEREQSAAAFAADLATMERVKMQRARNAEMKRHYGARMSLMHEPEWSSPYRDAFIGELSRVIPHNPASCMDPNCGQKLCEDFEPEKTGSASQLKIEDDEDSHRYEQTSQVPDQQNQRDEQQMPAPSLPSPQMVAHGSPVHQHAYHSMQNSYQPLAMGLMGPPMHAMGYQTMRPQQSPFMPMQAGPYEFPMPSMGYQTLPMRPPPGFSFPDPYQHQMSSPYYQQGSPFNSMPHPVHSPAGQTFTCPPLQFPAVFPRQDTPVQQTQEMVGESLRYAVPPTMLHPLQGMFQPPGSPMIPPPGLPLQQEQQTRSLRHQPQQDRAMYPLQNILYGPPPRTAMGPPPGKSTRFPKQRRASPMVQPQALDGVFMGPPAGSSLRVPQLGTPAQQQQPMGGRFMGPVPGGSLRLPPLYQGVLWEAWHKDSLQPRTSIRPLESVFQPPERDMLQPAWSPWRPEENGTTHQGSISPTRQQRFQIFESLLPVKESPGAPRMRNSTPVLRQEGGA